MEFRPPEDKDGLDSKRFGTILFFSSVCGQLTFAASDTAVGGPYGLRGLWIAAVALVDRCSSDQATRKPFVNGSSGTAFVPHGSFARLRLPRLDTVVEPEASKHRRKPRSGSWAEVRSSQLEAGQ